MTSYGFEIRVTPKGDGPAFLPAAMDEIVGRLVRQAAADEAFTGWMVTEHQDGAATFLISADAGTEREALSCSLAWLQQAVDGGELCPGCSAGT